MEYVVRIKLGNGSKQFIQVDYMGGLKLVKTKDAATRISPAGAAEVVSDMFYNNRWEAHFEERIVIGVKPKGQK